MQVYQSKYDKWSKHAFKCILCDHILFSAVNVGVLCVENNQCIHGEMYKV